MWRSQNEDGSLWCIVIFTPIVKKNGARQQGIINIARVMLASQSARKMMMCKTANQEQHYVLHCE
jgi:hypothetical protein